MSEEGEVWEGDVPVAFRAVVAQHRCRPLPHQLPRPLVVLVSTRAARFNPYAFPSQISGATQSFTGGCIGFGL